ncbi:hypothetical protein E2562_008755 [Oryza meyeriana var. granulata]|uniref:Uncharacterized protein n=1 Tax=Oryza meyeriana var. granulata TaxID=110450 RepID=A0A6G1D1S1_9ORYZ|nr:hypothetical protein E2562_008755 [Oryza meyeriana var. granulata]
MNIKILAVANKSHRSKSHGTMRSLKHKRVEAPRAPTFSDVHPSSRWSLGVQVYHKYHVERFAPGRKRLNLVLLDEQAQHGAYRKIFSMILEGEIRPDTVLLPQPEPERSRRSMLGPGGGTAKITSAECIQRRPLVAGVSAGEDGVAQNMNDVALVLEERETATMVSGDLFGRI